MPMRHSVHQGSGGGFLACITGHMTGSGFRGSASGGGQGPDPTDTWDTTGYRQQAESMHPTGMHSCLV